MNRELFWIHGSPYAWRVQLALLHKGLDYTSRLLSISSGELRSPEYLALNPRGKVPTLKDGDLVVYESLAILAYLDRRYPDVPLFGRTAAETGIVWRVIAEYTCYIDHAVEEFILPIYFGKAQEQAVQVRAAIGTLATELGGIDHALSHAPYLAGDSLTAADFVVFPHLQSILRAASKPAAQSFELPFLPLADRLPAIHAWMTRIQAMPGYESTYPPNWR